MRGETSFSDNCSHDIPSLYFSITYTSTRTWFWRTTDPQISSARVCGTELRCATLSPAPLWIISSLQTHLQTQIMFRSKRCAVSESVITHNSFVRRFTTARTSHPLLSICNTLTGEMPYNSTQRMHAPFPSLTPFKFPSPHFVTGTMAAACTACSRPPSAKTAPTRSLLRR